MVELWPTATAWAVVVGAGGVVEVGVEEAGRRMPRTKSVITGTM
jgi:hypothetical protein